MGPTVNLADFDFSLRWPQELFIWEAGRIAALRTKETFTNMVVCLFSEAFMDGDIAEQLGVPLTRNVFDQHTQGSEAADALNAIIKDQSLLHKYEPPRYWLERQGGTSAVARQKPLSKAFVELIDEMRELDYFPKVLGKGCVDDGGSWGEVARTASAEISRAIHVDVAWPLDESHLSIPDDVLYAVVEYLHDQAQRPRSRSLHSYGDCGWHYADHNKESGGVVYRWRVNELLERYGVALRLGSKGSEKGRLIRHAGFRLDVLADELSDLSADSDERLVNDAIQLYRARSSTTVHRRAALTQLANYLEKHRQTLKSGEFAKGDESDLFNIFNNFAIRHGKGVQKEDYGDEFLDWIFWTSLGAIKLVKELSQRMA
tara:strand:+ start:6749 stop:7867 length:1119 start_codon:yes stop_codon:yes gene_type:complete